MPRDALPALAACPPSLQPSRSVALPRLLAQAAGRTDYATKIAAARAAKDAQFAGGDDPIPQAKHARVPAARLLPDRSRLQRAWRRSSRSTTRRSSRCRRRPARNRKMRRVGTLEFTLKGQPLKLTAFIEVGTDPDSLFVPFSDLTSGTETYAAGRFLDLDAQQRPASTSSTSTAPTSRTATTTRPTSVRYPPPENRLKIPIRAGERMKKLKPEARSRLRAARGRLRLRRRDRQQRAAALPRLPRRARATKASRSPRRDYYARYLGFDDVGVFQAIGAARGALDDADASRDLVARKAVRLEELERDVSVLFPGAARRDRGARPPRCRSRSRRARSAPRSAACSNASVWPPVSRRSSPPRTRRPASRRRIPICARWRCSRRHAAGRSQPADCVAIEDSLWGLQSARAAGLRTVAVTHTYEAAAFDGAADLVIESLASLDLGALSRLYS